MRKRQVKILFLIFLIPFLFFSCDDGTDQRLEIGDRFFYWESTAESTIGDVMQNMGAFKKLEDTSINNLSRTLGKGSHYVWVRASFRLSELPEQFRNESLGLVVPRLRFAEQLFCNNIFISKYGEFPPREQSTLFKAHFFSFPRDILRRGEVGEREPENVILIKIYVQGQCGISSHAAILPARFAYPMFEVLNFHRTRVYIFLVGIMLFTFILYLSFYLKLPAFKEYLYFALVNIFTSFFLIQFFATELPLYTNGWIPYLPFIKFIWTMAYLVVYFASSFSMHYQHLRFSRKTEIVRLVLLAVQILFTLLAPSYDAMSNAQPLLLGMLAAQGGVAAYHVVKSLFHPQTRRAATEFATLFLPLTAAVILDVALRLHDNTQAYPVFSLFGWQFSILGFVIVLTTRFAKIYRSNEQLSDHLQEEVDTRTRDLQHVNHELAELNEHLEDEKFKADMDLQMAALVQQRFFPQPNRQFKGWDIAVYYSPSAIVSGDLYDYYNFNDVLNGLALFDVSGHGISASLVTMLAKNIISHQFQKGFRTKESIDKILTKINNILLSEKGDIENYLTGILCRFESNEDSGGYKVELGNAGHPYPLKFSAQDNEIFELRGNDGKKHYGAIGMQGIEISFAKSDFVMAEGDLLICYTDGLTEAANEAMEQFGAERVKQLIKENSTLSAGELLKLIVKAHRTFTKGKPLEDDVTIVIAKRTAPDAFVPPEPEEDFDTSEEVLELLPVEEA